MQLCPNLFFAGNAEEALVHYHDALGGEVAIVRFSGTPAAEFAPSEWADKILHASLRSPFGKVNVMDAPPGREGVQGGNFAIEIELESEPQAADVFSKLAVDGTVLMPFEQTFFARKFGMVNDKFGIRWMIHVAEASARS